MAKPEFGKTPKSLLDENGKFVDKFDQSAKLEAARAARLAEAGIVYDKTEAEFRGAEANRAKYAFICAECKQHFSTQAAHDNHVSIMHREIPTKKFCPNCGTECAFKAKFCPGCGKTIPEATKVVPRGMEDDRQKSAPVATWMASEQDRMQGKNVRAFDYSYKDKEKKNPDLKPGEREVWVEVDDSQEPKKDAAKPADDKPPISISADGRYKTTKIVGREPNPNRPGAAGAVAVADPAAAGGSSGEGGARSRKGWLRKAAAAKGGKDQVRGNWKDRWFVLAPAGSLLSYFENQHAVKPKGVIPLRGASVDFRSDVVGSPFVVWIATADGKFFYLEARSLEDANAWISDIQSVIGAKK